MFDVFARAYQSDATSPPNGATVAQASARNALAQLASRFGGCSFERALYRVFSSDEIPTTRALVSAAFPAFADRITPFATDWLGRVFCIDTIRCVDGEPAVLMLEPGTGEALEIPCTVEGFHDSELIEYKEEALAASFHEKWLGCGGIPPDHTQCVGYKIPLFLGGQDTIDNLAVSDFDVYWSIAAQLLEKTCDLPNGTLIDQFGIR